MHYIGLTLDENGLNCNGVCLSFRFTALFGC